jgi:hypothetical protein
MIFRRANPLLGALERVGPGNLDFLAQMALASSLPFQGTKKS